MLISVIISAYNGEKYILEQLQSIVNQTIKPNEIIIVDDKSTDNTNNIIKRFKNNNMFVNIRIYSNRNNLGFVKSFEKALKHSSGEIIFFSDQDDVWVPNKIESLLPFFKNNKPTLVFSNAQIVDKDLKDLKKDLFASNKIKDKDVEKKMMQKNIITGATMVINKELKELSLPFSPYIYHDYWIGLTAVLYGRIYICDEKLIKYRQHENNVIGINRISGKKIINKLNQKETVLEGKLAVDNLLKTTLKNNEFSYNKVAYAKLYEKMHFFNKRLKKCIIIDVMSFFKGEYFEYANGLNSLIKDLILHSFRKWGKKNESS